MRWVLLTASLLLILGAAIAYSLWDTAPELPHPEPAPPPPVVAARPRPMMEDPAPQAVPAPAPAPPSLAPAWVPQPAPPPPPPLPDQAPMVGFEDEVEPAAPDAGRVALTTAVAQGALRAKLGELQRCYQAWAESQGGNAPKRLVYTFVIEPTADQQGGEVSKVEIEGASDTAGLEACAKDVAKGIAFDAPRGPVRVPMPFAAWSAHAFKGERHGMEP